MIRLCPALLLAASLAPAQSIQKGDLFAAGEGGYATFRIPGIVAQGKVVLAYAEARKDYGDWADIDIVLRRSTDNGHTFSPVKVLVESGADTVNNPVAIVDVKRGRIHFLYCINYARAFYMRSDDAGLTFSKPVEITQAFESFRPAYNWNVIATGPGHGIQLKNGRLLVPVWLSTGGKRHRPSRVSTIYSDDNGRTWHAGQLVPDGLVNPSETYAVQLRDGRVLLNIRNESQEHRRALSTSSDGATNWSQPAFDANLLEPVCMASLIRHPRGALVFSNPHNLEATYVDASKTVNRDRKRLTLQLSPDDGQSWPHSLPIEEGLSGYSDLAVPANGHILVLYEKGGLDKNMFRTQSLTLARVPLALLSRGAPAPKP
jgi:sialidase-1